MPLSELVLCLFFCNIECVMWLVAWQATLAFCTKLKKKTNGAEANLGYLVELQKKASAGINSITNLSKAIRSSLWLLLMMLHLSVALPHSSSLSLYVVAEFLQISSSPCTRLQI